MKKILALALTLVFVFSLTACGENNTNGGNNQNNQNNQNSQGGSLTSDIMPNMSDGMNSVTDSAQNGTTSDTKISRDRAIEIALEAADVKKENARDFDVELDRERGVVVWDVDFETAEMEYSYDINAETGAVVKQDKERKD